MYAHEENIELMPDHFNKLDYELEFAIIIGKKGKNIVVEERWDQKKEELQKKIRKSNSTQNGYHK